MSAGYRVLFIKIEKGAMSAKEPLGEAMKKFADIWSVQRYKESEILQKSVLCT